MGNKEKYLNLLKRYDYAYYNDGDRLISDTEYDILKRKAKSAYPNDPYFKVVGAPVTGKKVTLPYKLGSLDKVGPDDIEKYLDDMGDDIVGAEKMDGASILVRWEEGIPVFGATRGDGETGQNISDKLKYFVPNIPEMGVVEQRGEAMLMGTSHIELGLKNRRNGVAGKLNDDKATPEVISKIVPVFYELIEAPVEFETEVERLEYIKSLGLRIPKYITPKMVGRDNFINAMNTMLLDAKNDGTYEIDGIVITQNRSKRQNVMIPSNRIAYKVNEAAIPVKVTGVEWNVSKGGKLIPTILLEPTDISGSTIARTTGFNAEYVINNGIDTGAIIGLIKAGNVIPYITEVLTPSDVPSDITTCPSCEGKLMWKGVDLVCANPDECTDAMIKKTAYFFKKQGSEYITETTIRNLGITSIEDAYELDELDVADMEGFGLKKGEQVVYEIQKTLNTTPAKLMAAFSIDGVGETVATQIVGQFKDAGEWFKGLDLDGVIGPKTAEKFNTSIGKYEKLYNFLLTKGLKFKENVMGELAGKQIALTGTGPVKRNELTKMIQAKGGMVKTVSKTTDYLVAEDPNGGSGKLQTARKYGTKIISYEELLEMVQ